MLEYVRQMPSVFDNGRQRSASYHALHMDAEGDCFAITSDAGDLSKAALVAVYTPVAVSFVCLVRPRRALDADSQPLVTVMHSAFPPLGYTTVQLLAGLTALVAQSLLPHAATPTLAVSGYKLAVLDEPPTHFHSFICKVFWLLETMVCIAGTERTTVMDRINMCRDRFLYHFNDVDDFKLGYTLGSAIYRSCCVACGLTRCDAHCRCLSLTVAACVICVCMCHRQRAHRRRCGAAAGGFGTSRLRRDEGGGTRSDARS